MIGTILMIAEFELYNDREYIENNIETYKGKTYKDLFSGNNFNDEQKEMFDIKYFNGEILEKNKIVRYVAFENENNTIVIRDS